MELRFYESLRTAVPNADKLGDHGGARDLREHGP